MHRAQKQKKQKKQEKQKSASDQTGESSQDASTSLPTTTPTTPGSMPPPSPPHPIQQQYPSKVAIPRLHRETDAQFGAASASSDHNRIAHACESCRQRKTKCSGERPACLHCQDFKLLCVYLDGKRDRARKEFDGMAEKLEEYEKLLKDIGAYADETTKQRIVNALRGEASPASEEPPKMAFSPDRRESRKSRVIDEPTGPFGEDRFSARAGSLESADRVDEDLDRNAKVRATGFYGKNSEITWMHRLRQRTETEQEHEKQQDGEPTSSTRARSGSTRPAAIRRPSAGLTSIISSTYHCDDLSLSIANLRVHKYDLPPRELADRLLQCYFDTVQPSFPVLSRINFLAEYHEFFSNSTVATDGWIAILNLTFAISAKFAHLVGAEWAGPEGDYLVYFTRARLLGFTEESILGHASIQHVQVCGLIAFFLMSIHQINRSWAVSGIATRHAATLGLNLCNSSAEVNDFDKEMRCRTWWALCFLERQLAVMTGRTPSFSDADCSCPQPFPIDEGSISNSQSFKLASHERFGLDDTTSATHPSFDSDTIPPVDTESPASQHVASVESCSPSIGLYFLHLTILSSFINEVLIRLYRVSNMNKSWAETQLTMATLTEKLESWRQELPLAFDFTKRVRDQHWVHQRKALGFLYHSTMLIINRPCLCRIDRMIPDESSTSKQFNRASATTCVHAAIDMLNLLPDEPDPAGMYTQSPWWSLVHHLVEAAVVCMLELSFRADHLSHEVDEIFESADKAVQWLWSMSNGDLAAGRAWKMCDEMLRKIAPKVGKTVGDMLSQQQHLPDPMQGFQQSSHAPASVFRPEQQGHQDLAPFQPPVFTTYDQMMAQDNFLQNLLQVSTPSINPATYPMTGDGEIPFRYGDQAAEGFFLDPNLE